MGAVETLVDCEEGVPVGVGVGCCVRVFGVSEYVI